MFKTIQSKIPKKRLMVYILILGILPLGMAFSHFMFQKKKLDNLQSHLERINELSIAKAKKDATNMIVRNHYKEADHFFIDKHLETLPLLRKEIEGLKKITLSETFTKNDWIEKRLNFLNHENRLTFSESSRQNGDKIEEVIETLSHPVEINTEDLLTILSRIEEKSIGHHLPIPHCPQLIITEFSLNKKKLNDENEVLLLNMKLLKREFL